jgi:hypothetical protein
MGVYRLYTGSDGESHIGEIKAEAPQHIKVIGVPGDVRLIEDITGKGHTTTYPDGLTATRQVAPHA